MAMSLPHDESGHGEVVAEINITPLTDIFLVLLIIFMVTSTTLMQSGVNVNLPRSRTASITPKAITSFEAKIAVGGSGSASKFCAAVNPRGCQKSPS